MPTDDRKVAGAGTTEEGAPLLSSTTSTASSTADQQHQQQASLYGANTNTGTSPYGNGAGYGSTAAPVSSPSPQQQAEMAAYAFAAAQYEAAAAAYYAQHGYPSPQAQAQVQAQAQQAYTQSQLGYPAPHVAMVSPPHQQAQAYPGYGASIPLPFQQAPTALNSNSSANKPPRNNIVNSSNSRRQPSAGSAASGSSGRRLSGNAPLVGAVFDEHTSAQTEHPLLKGSASNESSTNSNNYGSISPKPNTPSTSSRKVAPVMVRTSSSNDIMNNSNNKSTIRNTSNHQRSSSDLPRSHHRRTSSAASGLSGELPPMAGARSTFDTSGSSHNRVRSFSSGAVRPSHRRTDSMNSVSSMVSAASQVSVTSNIAKSTLFAGITDSGTVQLHFPYEATRLIMVENDSDIDDGSAKWEALEGGKLYMNSIPDQEGTFDTYHRLAEQLNAGQAPQWESMDGGRQQVTSCNCQCNHCNACIGKRELLPKPTYVLAVQDSVYRRVLDEIADADSMPCGKSNHHFLVDYTLERYNTILFFSHYYVSYLCLLLLPCPTIPGLFFCGHHEDVAYPSIGVPIVLLVILFSFMGYVAWMGGIFE